MTQQEMQALIVQLQTENSALKAKKVQTISFKVSDKGGLSVYGLGRFPVTLYKSQWLKLIGAFDAIKAFMVEHDAELKEKPVIAVVKAA